MARKNRAVAQQKPEVQRFAENTIPFERSRTRREVTLVPKTLTQEKYIMALNDESKNIVVAFGPAGTGKTMVAVQVAIKQLKAGGVDRIVVTRPAVAADEDLGFLPGTLEEKMCPWTAPIFAVFREHYTANEIAHMLKEHVIEICPLSFMRGRTFKDSFIIGDECQLTTPNQMKMLLTRIGEGSKMVITGDLDQADRGVNNGLIDFLQLYNKRPSVLVEIVQFSVKDVVRHRVVKDILYTYDGVD